jgi:hypothetical protein
VVCEIIMQIHNLSGEEHINHLIKKAKLQQAVWEDVIEFLREHHQTDLIGRLTQAYNLKESG